MMQTAPLLSLALKKTLGDLHLDVTQDLHLNGITVLFGASGSGKTSLLRLIAGLDQADTGHIMFCGEDWFHHQKRVCLKPNARRAGLVFQDALLFDHLTVEGDRKSTRLNSSHPSRSRMPSSA